MDPTSLLAGYSGGDERMLQMEDSQCEGVIRDLLRADDDSYIEREINDLESDYPGVVNAFSPPGQPLLAGMSRSEQIFNDVRGQEQLFASRLIDFIQNPFANGQPAYALQQALDLVVKPSALKAGLVGDHIEYLPTDYEPFYALMMRRGRSKAYKNIANGSDSIQYEAPLTFGTAYNFNPNGGPGGSLVQAVSGSVTTILPYWNASPRYSLSVFEWASRLLNAIMQMKARVTRDLDVALDSDWLTMFDAVVPNGTLYDNHTSHIATVQDTEGSMTYDKFMEGSRHATRHRESTGTKHRIIQGWALCDPEAIDDMEGWGNDQYTEIETSQFVQNGFGKRYGGAGLVNGRAVNKWKLLETPIEHATDSRRIRFSGDPRRVGYVGSVTFNGKAVFMKVGPQSGQDINVNEVQRQTEPPGFTFFVQANSGHYMQIINHFGISKINH